MSNKIIQTQNVIRRISRQTDAVLLFYSGGGKDSIALLDLVAPHFKKVYCAFGYFVKGMNHIQPYLDWAKRYGNTEVLQYEHPSATLCKKHGLFCDPDEGIKKISYGEWEKNIKDEVGVEYAFSGMKGVDGFMKRMRLKMWAKNDWINPKGIVYPLALWTNPEVLKYISNRNLIKPFTYPNYAEEKKRVKTSQGAGLNLNTLLHLFLNYKEDYKKIINEFPYAEKIIYDFVNS